MAAEQVEGHLGGVLEVEAGERRHGDEEPGGEGGAGGR